MIDLPYLYYTGRMPDCQEQKTTDSLSPMISGYMPHWSQASAGCMCMLEIAPPFATFSVNRVRSRRNPHQAPLPVEYPRKR